MRGWLIRLRYIENERERVCQWIVACDDWMKATDRARSAQGLSNHTVLSTRAVRAATAAELNGLGAGEARQLQG